MIAAFTKTVYFEWNCSRLRCLAASYTGILVDTQTDLQFARRRSSFYGFHATDSTKERITHVGIYIGNYEYIHAAGRIKLNSLDRSAHNFNEYRLNILFSKKNFRLG